MFLQRDRKYNWVVHSGWACWTMRYRLGVLSHGCTLVWRRSLPCSLPKCFSKYLSAYISMGFGKGEVLRCALKPLGSLILPLRYLSNEGGPCLSWAKLNGWPWGQVVLLCMRRRQVVVRRRIHRLVLVSFHIQSQVPLSIDRDTFTYIQAVCYRDQRSIWNSFLNPIYSTIYCQVLPNPCVAPGF